MLNKHHIFCVYIVGDFFFLFFDIWFYVPTRSHSGCMYVFLGILSFDG